MDLVVKNKNIELVKNIKIAEGFLDRLIGLMGKSKIEGGGLLIKSCNSVHTCFMRFPIHVIFLSSDYKVVKVIKSMKPWRFTRMYLKATQVLELDARLDFPSIENLEVGDDLEGICIN